jgi:hypothetical protein
VPHALVNIDKLQLGCLSELEHGPARKFLTVGRRPALVKWTTVVSTALNSPP